ncbi:MAG: phage tail sheath family protein [Bacteroidetes bacterium]|nr:MAG: phage tail sheath family protein [Bacteroidota bacterium]
MTASFLHGSETIELNVGARQIAVVKAAVIGLVGIAPKGAINTPILVLGGSDAAQFGSELPGFSIPQALNAIIDQGAGTIVVVNVFDPATMTTQVTDESHTVTGLKIKTTYPPIASLVVKNSGGSTTYVLDTDYTFDDFGNIQIIGTTIHESDVLKASYKKLDASAVTAAIINGAIDGSTEARTGMKCYDLCYNLFGFNPKIIIAPNYSSLLAVATEMTVVANKFKGFALKDAPNSTTVAVALAGRGTAGAINFNTSSKRDLLLFPMLKAYDAYTDADQVRSYSSYFAGVWSATIANEGFHVSPSNHQIQGITGIERNITAMIDDPDCEANTLNAAGIITLFGAYGTGIRTWGNRSAAYPSSTLTRDVFIPCQMTASILDESIRWAMLQFIDKPVDNAWIDSVRESVNGFIRTLVGRGALIDGVCIYDPADNPTSETGAGHYTFSYSFAAPTPGERITFKSTFDINLLKNLK